MKDQSQKSLQETLEGLLEAKEPISKEIPAVDFLPPPIIMRRIYQLDRSLVDHVSEAKNESSQHSNFKNEKISF